MYCPNCRGDFVAGVEVCNSCDIALVDALPEEPERPPIDWITVATYREPTQARLASEYLERARRDNRYKVLLTLLVAAPVVFLFGVLAYLGRRDQEPTSGARGSDA